MFIAWVVMVLTEVSKLFSMKLDTESSILVLLVFPRLLIMIFPLLTSLLVLKPQSKKLSRLFNLLMLKLTVLNMVLV